MAHSGPDTDSSPDKMDTVSPTARELADRERELDACMHAVYGCSLAEYCDKAFAHGSALGFELGERSGRRIAKGLETPPKKRGRPLEIDGRKMVFLIELVERRKPDQTIKEAVTNFLRNLEVGSRVDRWLQENNLADPTDTSSLPDHVLRVAISPAAVTKALWAYYRHRPHNRPS